MLENIRVEEIKLLALSPRLDFDDEALSLIFIMQNNKRKELKYQYWKIPIDEIEKLELSLKLKNSISKEWQKISYERHQDYEIKIIYPNDLYWVDFLDNGVYNRFLKVLKFFRIIPISSGCLNSKVKTHLENT